MTPAILARAIRIWGFADDVTQLGGDAARASARVAAVLMAWRDAHAPDDDPLLDDSLAPFHVSDVSALLHECQRLWRIEQHLLDALTTETNDARG